ncbi:MAG: hypothetical protein CO108_00415 [Deltaproteobacteria bacterium CG_4_9_14_3_um_filter_63_12]|nr:MAG: hypothetical protein CO108_00415 [Deltaproteobacteria bacterium CG_4_9_14_3_um_filter_63_12]
MLVCIGSQSEFRISGAALSSLETQIVIVDLSVERVAFFESLFVDAGCTCHVLNEWQEAEELLLGRILIPGLVVVGFEALASGGLETVSNANKVIESLGAPSILVYGHSVAGEVEFLKTFCRYAAHLELPQERDDVLQVLADLLPEVDFGSAPSAAIPEDLRPLSQPESVSSWVDLERLVEDDRGTRVVVTMPSLSSGSLRDVPLARLLYFLAMQRRTGVLSLRNGPKVHQAQFSNGGLLADQKDPRTLKALQAAFAWTDGEYTFTWERLAGGQLVPLYYYLFEGLQHVSMNAALERLALFEQGFLAHTTLFFVRLKEIKKLGQAAEVARLCKGEKSLADLLRDGAINIHSMLVSLNFCLSTDLVTILDKAASVPVGLSYKLHHRLEGVGGGHISELPHSSIGEDSGFRRQNYTAAQINRLDPALAKDLLGLETTLKTILQKDAYEVFNLYAGCGRQAVRLAYSTLRARLPNSPANVPAPIWVTAQLVETALRDSYVLLMAQETEETGAPERQDNSGRFPREESGLTRAEHSLMADWEVKLGELASGDPYEAFDLWEGCGRKLIIKAYQALEEQYGPNRANGPQHPDVVAAMSRVYGALKDVLDQLLVSEKTKDPTRDRQKAFDSEALSLNTVLEQLAYAERRHVGAPVAEPTTASHELAPRSPQVRSAKKNSPELEPTPRDLGPKAYKATVPKGPLQTRHRVPMQLGAAAPEAPAPEAPAPEAPAPEPSAPERPRPRPVQSISSSSLAIAQTSEDHFRQGLLCLQSKAINAAREHFKYAVVGREDNGRYQAYFAWASFLLHPSNLDRTRAELKQAKRLTGGVEAASFFLGIIEMNQGDLAKAEKYLKVAERENAENHEVRRALRLVKARMEAGDDKKGGLLKSLFKA